MSKSAFIFGVKCVHPNYFKWNYSKWNCSMWNKKWTPCDFISLGVIIISLKVAKWSKHTFTFGVKCVHPNYSK